MLFVSRPPRVAGSGVLYSLALVVNLNKSKQVIMKGLLNTHPEEPCGDCGMAKGDLRMQAKRAPLLLCQPRRRFELPAARSARYCTSEAWRMRSRIWTELSGWLDLA